MSEPDLPYLPKRSVISYEDVDHGVPNESMTYHERPHSGPRKHKKRQRRPLALARSTFQSHLVSDDHVHGNTVTESYNDSDMDGHDDDDEDEDDDDDQVSDSFQRAVLPVATQLSDETLGPQTGEEYLLTVRREAKCLPNVFLATFMPVKKDPSVMALSHVHPGQPEPLHIQFAEEYMAYFVSLKNLFLEVSQCYRDEPPVDSFHEYGKLNLFPKNLDAKAWYQWMYGKSESPASQELAFLETETETETELDKAVSDDGEQNETANKDKATSKTLELNDEQNRSLELSKDSSIIGDPNCTLPLAEPSLEPHLHPEYEAKFQELHVHVQFLSFLLKFDQRIVLRLLKLHETWLKMTDITELQSQWIFNLLIRLNPLLTSNEMSVLRDLCRKYLAIRQKVLKSCTDGSEDQRMKSLDMTICIITMYYGQRDLLLNVF